MKDNTFSSWRALPSPTPCFPSLVSCELSQTTHLTVVVVPISAHQVDTMTVLIPESSFVGQSAVGDGRVCVLVIGGEGSAIVVVHGVTWLRAEERIKTPPKSQLNYHPRLWGGEPKVTTERSMGMLALNLRSRMRIEAWDMGVTLNTYLWQKALSYCKKEGCRWLWKVPFKSYLFGFLTVTWHKASVLLSLSLLISKI